MIIKSYEVKKNKLNLLKYNFFLLYGENLGLKKDIRKFIKLEIEKKNNNVEILFLYESEILDNEENFYNFIYSGSLFSNKKIITIYETTDKIIKKISDIYDKYPDNVFLIIFSEILEKKSKLRNFFETNKKTICIPCYLDNERDLRAIALSELKKNNIMLSQETVNLLIEKSNSDRNNLRNEIEKWMEHINSTADNYGQATIGSVTNFGTGTAKLVHFQKDGKKTMTYEFVDIWPTTLSEIALSYDTASDIEQFDVTWAYQHYKVTPKLATVYTGGATT